MNYAVVATIDDIEINEYRKKYDPKVNFIPPHITFVFHFSNIDESLLIKHISLVLDKFNSFPISFNEIEKSSDNYIFLLIKEGKDICIDIHDSLYKGALESYLRKDLAYDPHLTIAQTFPDSKVDNMVEEAEKLLTHKMYAIVSLKLIGIEDLNKPRIDIKEFQLKR